MIAMRSHVGLLRFVGSANGLPPLLLRAGDARDFAVGRGEPEVVLKASLFELLRATGGRRSLDQLRAMDWSPAPGPWLDHIVMPSYGLPDADQVE